MRAPACYVQRMVDGRLVEVLRAVLASHAEVSLAILFGSRARGVARADSDVDVAVAGDVDRLALAAELTRASGLEVAVIELGAAGYPLLSALVADAVLLHEGVPAAYGAWRSHALSQLDLDRAWFARMRDGYLAKVAAGGAR